MSKLSIRSLRAELKEAGAFETRELNTWMRWTGLVTALTALYVTAMLAPWWSWFVIVPVASIIMTVITFYAHEGGHKALSKSGFRNAAMINLGFPFFAGLSALYWKQKHNVSHHTHPNVADEDPDLLLWPMASTAYEYRRSGPKRQWFQRNLQGGMFWILTLFLGWSMRTSTAIHLIGYAKKRGIDKKWLVDVGLLALHVCLWLVLPAFFVPFHWALIFYVATWTITGTCLSAVFAPAHMGLPVLSGSDDIWRLQFETTRNLTLPWGMSWMFVGLDYQVEHHLFPRIPHQNMKIASKVTREWAKKNGVAYQTIGYFSGLVDVTRFMQRAWSIEPADSYEEAMGLEPRIDNDVEVDTASIAPTTPPVIDQLPQSA